MGNPLKWESMKGIWHDFWGGPEENPRWKAQPCDRISLMFRGPSLKLG